MPKQRDGIRTTTEIQHKFNDAEFREKSRELSNKLQAIEQRESEHKAASAVAKSAIKLLRAEVNALRMQLDNGFENRVVPCVCVMDRKKGEKTFYDVKTDAKLKTEDMNEMDYEQLGLQPEPEKTAEAA